VNSGEVLQVETGSLYPALHRLERQRWVRSEGKHTESKQRAKYYRITAVGKKQVAHSAAGSEASTPSGRSSVVNREEVRHEPAVEAVRASPA
jgi:DNA-binding PadR family transcriptional regulator